MHQRARQRRIEAFERACRERGRRCTAQRRVIFDALLELQDHPTAEQVYEQVLVRLPDVARTTVYRTLDELVLMGQVGRASHRGHSVRYDVRTERHHHLVCMECNAVADIIDTSLDAVVPPDTSAVGFHVTDVQVQLRGICASCRTRERKEEST